MDADAIVIGAGAAGLAAARRLAERSLRVVLLEARDRVGGRVWSLPLGPRAAPAELGGEFIHGHAPQTMALLREAGVTVVATGDEGWEYHNGRLQLEQREFRAAATIFDGALSQPEDESVDRYLRRFEGHPSKGEVVKAARSFVEGFDAADPAIASARAIAQEWRSGVDSFSARPVGGYGPMVARLVDRCITAGVRLTVSTAVRRISWRAGEVAVETMDAQGQVQTWHAQAAIVTLPVGVLRYRGDGAIAFDPELPASQRNALAFIESGHVVKVTLSFRSAFWEEIADGRFRDGAFFRGEGSPFAGFWTQVPVRTTLAVAWAGGPKAVALDGLPQADLVELAVREFGGLFGEPELALDEFADAAAHCWGDDPFARGAYSYVAVGGGNARATLGEPVAGTLFFAGEATSTDGHGGTVNGALEMGERAAAEVIERCRL